MVGEHFVNLVEEMRYLGTLLSLHGLAHERSGRDGDRAAFAVEAHIGDAIAIEPHRDVQAVAAQRVVSVGRGIRRIQSPEKARALVVIEDHVAVEVLEVHQVNTSRALASALTSASMSDS